MPPRRLSKRPSAQVWGQKPGQLGEHRWKTPARGCVNVRSQARQGCWVESGAKMVRSMVRRNWAKGGRSWSVLLAAGACACALTLGLSGCVFTTPPRAEVKRERVEPSLTSSDLVSEGYLTVAMDTTEAPQAMIETDGTPSGYYLSLIHI